MNDSKGRAWMRLNGIRRLLLCAVGAAFVSLALLGGIGFAVGYSAGTAPIWVPLLLILYWLAGKKKAS
jgi:hypothetical protein